MSNKSDPRFSKITEKVITFPAPSEQKSILSGDYEEEYKDIAGDKGIFRAKLWLWGHVIHSLPFFMLSASKRNNAMLKNYFKVAVRNLKKQKSYSAINIFGLSVGLTCCILIYLYVKDEFSFDKFHKNAESIYSVITAMPSPDGSPGFRFKSTPLPLGKLLVDGTYPQVENTLRLARATVTFRHQEQLHQERLTFADSHIFDMFSFALISGEPASVLIDENSIVITESIAEKYFGKNDPIGTSFIIRIGDESKEFTISGIAANPPENSSIDFSILTRLENFKMSAGANILNDWFSFNGHTYLQVAAGYAAESVEEILANTFENNMRPIFGNIDNVWSLQKLTDLHLDPSLSTGSSATYSYILISIAVTVLFIALINFTNLSIGRSSVRSVEIGMRKILGAQKNQLIKQFWVESIILTVIAMLMGMLLANLMLPVFNDLSGKSLALSDFTNTGNIIFLGALSFFIGIIAGSYPALIMAGFRPIEILKNKLALGGKNSFTRSLVVVQFALSVFLIISTIVMGEQIDFLLNKDIGIEKEGIVAVYFNPPDADASRAISKRYKEKILPYASIKNVSTTNLALGANGSLLIDLFQKKNDERFNVYKFQVDYDYLETLGLELVSGRNFSEELFSDTTGVIINEAFAEALGIRGPTDHPILSHESRAPGNKKVLGIVKDYHYATLQDRIEPSYLYINPHAGMNNMAFVRVAKDNIAETIDVLRVAWQEIEPNTPFSYSFLDEEFSEYYDNDRKWGAIISYSSFFAVLIACIGILGLTSITVYKKIKEIGVRKVLGANVFLIIFLLVKEYFVLIIIANMLAWPLAYYGMSTFLQEYYYRIALDVQYFLMAGALSLTIAFSVIFYTALKAALSNPIDALRYE